MPIGKGSDAFNRRDIFVDYDFEEVMFRWDHVNRLRYRKFYGMAEDKDPIPHDNGLYNDALRYGEEISSDEYKRGKQKQRRK